MSSFAIGMRAHDFMLQCNLASTIVRFCSALVLSTFLNLMRPLSNFFVPDKVCVEHWILKCMGQDRNFSVFYLFLRVFGDSLLRKWTKNWKRVDVRKSRKSFKAGYLFKHKLIAIEINRNKCCRVTCFRFIIFFESTSCRIDAYAIGANWFWIRQNPVDAMVWIACVICAYDCQLIRINARLND